MLSAARGQGSHLISHMRAPVIQLLVSVPLHVSDKQTHPRVRLRSSFTLEQSCVTRRTHGSQGVKLGTPTETNTLQIISEQQQEKKNGTTQQNISQVNKASFFSSLFSNGLPFHADHPQSLSCVERDVWNKSSHSKPIYSQENLST